MKTKKNQKNPRNAGLIPDYAVPSSVRVAMMQVTRSKS